MDKKISQYFSFTIFLILLTSPITSHSLTDYQVEYNVGRLSNKTYFYNTLVEENKFTVLNAKVFFDKVEVGLHPYAEAAFFNKTSNLNIGYIGSKETSDDADITGIILSVDYITPDSSLIFQTFYSTTDTDYKYGYNTTLDILTIGIGAYINDHSAINISYSQQDTDASRPYLIPKNTELGIGYKQVKKLDVNTAFNFEASYLFYESNNSINGIKLSGDYYFNQSISVGGTIEKFSDDYFDEGKTLGINVNIFITAAFAIYAEFNQSSDKGPFELSSDEIIVGASARF